MSEAKEGAKKFLPRKMFYQDEHGDLYDNDDMFQKNNLHEYLSVEEHTAIVSALQKPTESDEEAAEDHQKFIVKNFSAFEPRQSYLAACAAKNAQIAAKDEECNLLAMRLANKETEVDDLRNRIAHTKVLADKLNFWLSAAIEDHTSCSDLKITIKEWLKCLA